MFARKIAATTAGIAVTTDGIAARTVVMIDATAGMIAGTAAPTKQALTSLPKRRPAGRRFCSVGPGLCAVEEILHAHLGKQRRFRVSTKGT